MGQAYLGFFYANGRGGLPKDDREAARLYKLAADRGNAFTQSALEEIGARSAPPALATRAQEPLPLVGFLYLGKSIGNLLAFRQGLAEAGFVEGKNVRFEFHGSAINEGLRALAVQLVNNRPAVIVALGSPVAVLAAKAASSTVPIVFATNLDPLKYGFVTSLNRPGGNMTGISLLSSELGTRGKTRGR